MFLQNYLHIKDTKITKERPLNPLYNSKLITENPSEKSYTTSLFNEGLPKIAQKVGEEGTEVVVAALAQDDRRLIEEVADLIYHTLVLLSARGLTPADVIAELEKRHK